MTLSDRILNALEAASIEGGQPGFDRGFTYVEIETDQRLITITGTSRDHGDATVHYDADDQHRGLNITSIDLGTGAIEVLHDSHGTDAAADVKAAVTTLRRHLN